MSKECLSFIDNIEQILEIYKRAIFPNFPFEDQKQLHIIFNEYKDKTRNNTSILEIIETTKMALGLKKSLSEIINIYNSNLNLFWKLDTYSICYKEIRYTACHSPNRRKTDREMSRNCLKR
jgi:hypothetical protein